MAEPIDVHATVYRAKAALHCIGQLAGEKKTLHEVHGYGLQCLLDLVDRELSEALEAMGGDPDLIGAQVNRGAH